MGIAIEGRGNYRKKVSENNFFLEKENLVGCLLDWIKKHIG